MSNFKLKQICLRCYYFKTLFEE